MDASDETSGRVETIRRFALLEHSWNGVHWDFLVESVGGVEPPLATWSMDEPIRAGVEIPALARAPHRWIYLDYEGEISGGRGSVRRLAGGRAKVVVWEEDRVELELEPARVPEGDQLAGPVVLRRAGGPGSAAWFFRLGKLS